MLSNYNAKYLSVFGKDQSDLLQSSFCPHNNENLDVGRDSRELRMQNIRSGLIKEQSCILTYLLTPRSTVFLEKLTGYQLIKKFSAFYEKRKFITAFTAFPIMSQLDPVHTLTPHIMKIHLNIILPSTPWSPQWSLSLRLPYQNPVHASPLPSYALYVPPISFISILLTAQYWHYIHINKKYIYIYI
jgi:hypothetical protein